MATDGGNDTFPPIPDGGSIAQPKSPLEVWRYCVRAAAHYERKAAELLESGRTIDAAVQQRKADWSNRFATLWEGLAKDGRNPNN